MSQANESVSAKPVFNRNTLEEIVDTLSKTPSRKKPDIIRSAQKYLLSHPAVAMTGISALSEMRKLAPAQELLEALRPEKIIDYLSRYGRIAGKEDFTVLFQALNAGSGEEILIPMLFGYLSKPTKALTQAHTNEKANIRIDQERVACLMANRVGLNLVEALYEFHDTDARRRLLQIVYKSIVLPELPVNTLVDFLLANASFAQPYEEAAKASAIVFALDTLFHLDINKRIAREYGNDNSNALLIVAYGKGRKPLSLTIPLGKKPDLRKGVWGDPKQPHAHAWQQQTVNMLQNIHAFTRRNTFGDLLLESIDEPLPLAVATVALRRILEREVTIEIERQGLDSRIIPAPNGRTIFVAGEQFVLEEPETFQRVRKKIQQFIQDEVFVSASGELHPEEINTILEFLKPGEIDYEVVAQTTIPRLTGEVQGGLCAISQRGVVNELRLPEEEYLREMRLSEIAFFQTKEGIKVMTKWGNDLTFSFMFDWNYKVSELERLGDDNRNFLILMALSYLKALKNQDVERVKYLDESETGTAVGETGNEEEKGKKRTISGRAPYLMMLGPGEKARKLQDEKSERDVQQIWGVGLTELNAMLLYLQQNRDDLENPESDVNKFLKDKPAGESIKRLLEKLLTRIIGKKSQPRFHDRQLEDGRIIKELVLEVPPDGYDASKGLFMVTYAPEIVRSGGKPRHTTCPGVARAILETMYEAKT